MNGNARRRFAAWALAVGAGLAVSSAVAAVDVLYATAAGIDVFVYDWYWAKGKPIPHEALKKAVAPDGAGTRE